MHYYKVNKEKNGYLIFDINVKNYNDLLVRQDEREVIPLVLVLIVLPSIKDNWVETLPYQTIINAEKYWFYPDSSLKISKNIGKTRILIPIENKVGANFFSTMFDYFHGKSV